MERFKIAIDILIWRENNLPSDIRVPNVKLRLPFKAWDWRVLDIHLLIYYHFRFSKE